MNEDDELVGRLLDAARNDVASGEAERQARLHDRVVGAGPGGGGPGASGPAARSFGSTPWVRAAGLCAGVAALALLGSSFVRAPSRASAPLVAATPPSQDAVAAPTAPLQEAPPAPLGVWQLPSMTAEAAPRGSSAASGVVSDDDTLAADLAALEKARQHLRAGDPRAALTALDELERRSPRSRVGDEATVLRIEVLSVQGRSDEGRRLAARFLETHPGSIYRPRIAQSLGEDAP